MNDHAARNARTGVDLGSGSGTGRAHDAGAVAPENGATDTPTGDTISLTGDIRDHDHAVELAITGNPTPARPVPGHDHTVLVRFLTQT